jgi:hypothetical protein
MQTLVTVALGDRFPEQCKEWRAMKQDIRGIFMREQMRRKCVVSQDLANTEGSLRRALREGVVDHVIGLFPYVAHHRRVQAYGAYLILQVAGSRCSLTSPRQHGQTGN